mmetsp:Transcript_23494/g.11297  ORF Transcript_23494/g.11297 Transcript_23494/m.11297 type:complete len:349 (+) Transcript_23494:1080-2126(+)
MVNSFIDINNLRIGIVGAGGWGTALANLLAYKGYKIDLWAYEKDVVDQIEKNRENKEFLPGMALSENIQASNDIKKVVSGKILVLIAVPSTFIRSVGKQMADSLLRETLIVNASKGIESKTCLTMSDVLKQVLPEVSKNQFAVISGPSFAKEVAKRIPTAITVAANSQDVAIKIQHIFADSYFRVYTSDDVIGVELGGAIKNVIAIASGISDGMNLGLNARAALVTRGLTEIRRLGLKMGASAITFTGLAVIGDLILTCTGNLSRNHTVGKKLGEGKKLDDILAGMKMIAEGVENTRSVYELSNKLEVKMPICNLVYRILYEGMSPQKAIKELMQRDLKCEFDDGCWT